MYGIFTLHLVDFYGKCRWICHTWILWVLESYGAHKQRIETGNRQDKKVWEQLPHVFFSDSAPTWIRKAEKLEKGRRKHHNRKAKRMLKGIYYQQTSIYQHSESLETSQWEKTPKLKIALKKWRLADCFPFSFRQIFRGELLNFQQDTLPFWSLRFTAMAASLFFLSWKSGELGWSCHEFMTPKRLFLGSKIISIHIHISYTTTYIITIIDD